MNPRESLKKHGVPEATIERFLAFHRENPGVWRSFEQYALQAAKSRASLGAKAIMERVRWEAEVERKQAFKCNNNFTAYYARIFADKYPQYKTIFEFRHIRGLKDEDTNTFSLFPE